MREDFSARLFCSKCLTHELHLLNNDLTGDEYYCTVCRTVRPLNEKEAILTLLSPLVKDIKQKAKDREPIRVRFTAPFENFPHLIVDKGATGIIKSVDDEIIYVQMDNDFKGYDAEIWKGEGWGEREVHVHVEALEYYEDEQNVSLLERIHG